MWTLHLGSSQMIALSRGSPGLLKKHPVCVGMCACVPACLCATQENMVFVMLCIDEQGNRWLSEQAALGDRPARVY